MLGALIGAGANLLGGVLGKNAAKAAAARQEKLQREFAQSGIQWKVEDAKKAGIHPLAALGAPTVQYSPMQVGDGGFASGIAAAGQDIARAVDSTRTQSQKLDAYGKTVQDLTLQRMGLENQLLASQVAKLNQAGVAPPMPSQSEAKLIEGQGQSPLIKNQPMERQASDPKNPSIEAGVVSDTGFSRTPTGWAVGKSKDVQERLEDDIVGTIAHNIRNRLYPMIWSESYNPPFPAPAGKMWYFHIGKQEYQLRPATGAGRFSGDARIRR